MRARDRDVLVGSPAGAELVDADLDGVAVVGSAASDGVVSDAVASDAAGVGVPLASETAGTAEPGTVASDPDAGAPRLAEMTSPTIRTMTQTTITIQAHTGADAQIRFTIRFIVCNTSLATPRSPNPHAQKLPSP